MTRIKQTDILQPALKVQAEGYHRQRGDKRIRVARTYRVEKTRDGSGAEEYVLTRYETNLGAAMSALLRVEGQGWELRFTEVHRDDRQHEGRMMVSWYDENGALKDGQQ